jgi:hypothetical protein
MDTTTPTIEEQREWARLEFEAAVEAQDRVEWDWTASSMARAEAEDRVDAAREQCRVMGVEVDR